MVYTRNQPIATDDLDISQPFLATNTNAADDSFGVDHYKFSDLTVNNGFHDKVTTPSRSDPATVANPILFCKTVGNSGALQYSRGPSNAVPSPVTTLQAPAVGVPFGVGVITNVIDFTGMPGVLAMLYYAGYKPIGGILRRGFSEVAWNGAIATVENYGTGGIAAQIAGTVLQLQNNTGFDVSPLVWTLQFFRIS